MQQLPWENIDILRPHPVSRMPSLSFILSHFSNVRLIHLLLNSLNGSI